VEIARKVFKHGQATCRLIMDSDGTAILKSVYSQHKGAGDATELLSQVVEFLEVNNLVCFLEARSYGTPGAGLNNRQLQDFYSRFGFERDPKFRGIWMFRVPMALQIVKEKSDEKTQEIL
jgi:GNAT superfamily N-acetyltransferase